MNDRLKVVAVGARSSQSPPSRRSKRQEAVARFERLWLVNPQEFNPQRNARQRERCEDLWSLITRSVQLEGSKVADLGCGTGWLTRRLLDHGAEVHALDVASNALKPLPDSPKLTRVQALLPHTDLPDDFFDLVVCADVIAELDPQEYRLMAAEIYRLLCPSGLAICSSDIDITTSDALPRFEDLLAIELDPLECHYRYHSWHIRWINLLRACRQKGLANKLNQSEGALNLLERLNRMFRGRKGISHATVLAKRRLAFTPFD